MMDAFALSLNTLVSSGASRWQDLALTNFKPQPNESGVVAAFKRQQFSLVKNIFATNFDESVSEDMTAVYLATAHQRPRDEDYDSVLSTDDLLPLQKAREFLSFLSVSLAKRDPAAMKSLPILLFCDGHVNRQKIFFIHILKTAHLPKCDLRDIFEYTVQTISLPGRFHESKLPTKPLSVIGRPLLFQPHLFNSVNGLGKDECVKNLSVASSSRFLLYETTILDPMRKFLSELQKSFITIDVASSHANTALECTSRMSTVTINICPIPGDIRSPAFKWYKDLTIIEGLLEVFGPERQIIWHTAGHVMEDEEAENEEPMIKQVDKFLNTFGLQQFKKGDKKNTAESELVILPERSEFDFTEALWKVLKKVQSLDELLQCLKQVRNKIASGGNPNFWIHSDNRTKLAKLVKSAYEGPITSLPSLKPIHAVCMLIEMGMDCMQRDYLHFFGQQHVLSINKLKEHFTNIPTDVSEEEKMKERFNVIVKFHHILELSVKCMGHFSLNKKKVNQVVESGLDGYLHTEVDLNRVFTVDVTYKDVDKILDVAQRQLWKALLYTENRNGKNTAIMCWTKEFPLKKLVPDYIKTTTTTTEPDDGKSYYLSTLKQCIHAC